MAEVYDRSKDGLLEIVDITHREGSHFHVTVRELIGGIDSWNINKRALEARMRRLALKCVSDPLTTSIANRSESVCYRVTFCVVTK